MKKEKSASGCPECHGGHPDIVDALAHTAAQIESAAHMCQALSDPGRLRLLLWLAQREMCVSELVERDQAKLASVSSRLKILHGARLLHRRREAKHIFYSIADDHVRRLLESVMTHASEP